MRLRNEAKVGLVIFSAIVGLIGIYWFLGGLRLRASSYDLYAIFPNAQKLDKGSVVRMAGVKVGLVGGLRLTKNTEARVDLIIDKGITIPKDSVARITTGGFIGDNFIDVAAGASKEPLARNGRLKTAETVQPDQLMQQAGELLSDLRQSAAGINEILGDEKTLAMIKETVKALKEASVSASEMTRSAQSIIQSASPGVQHIMANLDSTTMAANRTMSELEAMLSKDVRPNVKSLMEHTDQVVQHLDNTISQAQELLEAVKSKSGTVEDTVGKVGTALDSINLAAQQATEMLTNLNQASVGIKNLSTDEDLKADLKATLRNAAKASEQMNELATSLNKKYGLKKASLSAPRSQVPQYGLATNSLWNTKGGDYRVDGYYTLAGRDDSFYRLGAYNIGENTQAILQGGKAFGGNALRYGLYASRIGFGLDRRVGGSGLLSADIFRPNDPMMEVRGVVPLSDSLGVYLGTNGPFDDLSREVLVGVRYRSK